MFQCLILFFLFPILPYYVHTYFSIYFCCILCTAIFRMMQDTVYICRTHLIKLDRLFHTNRGTQLCLMSPNALRKTLAISTAFVCCKVSWLARQHTFTLYIIFFQHTCFKVLCTVAKCLAHRQICQWGCINGFLWSPTII